MNTSLKPRILFVVLLILMLSSGCSFWEIVDEATGIPTLPPTISLPTDSSQNTSQVFSVYFTEPYYPDTDDWHGGPEEFLAAAIDGAQKNVYIAIYSLSLNSIGDAILRAHQRGVDVRIVMEKDNMDRTMPSMLEKQGIPIVGDEGNGRMHNKFIIIDKQEVWTGSMNLTGTGNYTDHNNLVRIRSARMALNYLNEFEEMYTGGQFGAGSPNNTPNPVTNLDGYQTAVFFSPDDGVADKLVFLIESAETSIDFLAFSFTSDEIAEAMLERAEDGVVVRGVFDEEQAMSNTGGEFENLRNAGLDVHIDGNPGQMHHKVIIVDGTTVSFGSYNFSRSAETRNDENVMIVENPELAAQFEAEFEKIYGAAE